MVRGTLRLMARGILRLMVRSDGQRNLEVDGEG
jgi:hypothetical protein